MAASLSSSSGEQQYSLRWNDFHSSILSTFRHLKDEEDFVDVTLACDRDSFTAHKVVLSACSPYFRQLLKANPCQHPIVILRDVASSEMESLLRFMYHGEVHVGQEQLAAFLKTAQMLQVRGLADVNSNSASTTTATKTPITTNRSNGSAPATPRCGTWQDTSSRLEMLNENGSSPPPEKRSRSYSPPIEASRLLANHVSTGKTEHLQESLLGQALEGGPTIHTSSSNNVHSQIEDSNSMSENDDDNTNHDSLINSVKTEPNDLLNDSLEHHRNSFPAALLGLQGLMPGPSGIHAATNQDPNYAARRGLDMMRVRATDPRPCPKCGKIYRSAHTLRTHLEDKHTVCPGYRCVLCGTVAKSRNSLHSHMSRQHRGISTKDLPVLPMPSPFDPEMASRLLAKAGVKVSAQELRARASPTQGGPRRSDSRLELSRAAPSDAGSSDPEDLSTPLSLSRYEPSPNNNTVIRAVAAKSNLDSNQQHGTREPHIAPFQQHQQLQQLQHLHHQQQQPHGASATGSAIVDTFLQFIAENSGLNTEQAVAYAAQAKLAQISALDKFAARQGPPRDYPIIGRDPNTEDRHPPPNIHDSSNLAGDSSADEDDEDEDDDVHDADNEDVRSEPETLKAE